MISQKNFTLPVLMTFLTSSGVFMPGSASHFVCQNAMWIIGMDIFVPQFLDEPIAEEIIGTKSNVGGGKVGR